MKRGTDWGVALAVVVTAPVMFFSGVLVAHVLPDGDSKALVEVIATAAGAFIGTIAGAWIALYGDRQRRVDEKEDRDIGAANIAILQLGRAVGYLSQYQQNAIEPVRHSNLRWFLMARIILEPPGDVGVDVVTLGFLFESTDPNVPNDVSVEFDRLRHILSMIERVKTLLVESHGRMEGMHIIEDSTWPEIEAACGKKNVVQMKGLNSSIVDQVDRTLISMRETARRVHAATHEMYGDRPLIAFSDKE